MKKLFYIVLTALVLSFGYLTIDSLHALDLYDSSNLTIPNGGTFTYTDYGLTDGWYTLTLNEACLDNAASMMTISYYTDDLTSGDNFFSTNYVDGYDFSTDFVANIYIENGSFKLVFSGLDALTAGLVSTNMSIELIGINELDADNLTVTSSVITYESDLLDGWYQLDIIDNTIIDFAEFLNAQYYTDDFSVGSNFFTSDLTDNVDTTTSGEIHAEIYIDDGNFEISSFSSFSVALANVTNINLTLIELDTAPVFNYTELILTIPYNDIPSINEVKAMLTASDSQDGDLTSSITLYDENLTDYVIGVDDTIEYYELNNTATAYTIDFADLENYSLYVDNNGWQKISELDNTVISFTNSFFNNGVGAGLSPTFTTVNTTSSITITNDLNSAVITFNSDGSYSDNDMLVWENDSKIYLVKDDLMSEYYSVFSVDDSRGNTSYLTVLYKFTDDYIGTITYSDDLNNINLSLSDGDDAELIFYAGAESFNLDFVDLMYDDVLLTKDANIKTFNDLELAVTYHDGEYLLSDTYDTALYFERLFQDDIIAYIDITFFIFDDIAPSFDDTPTYLYISNIAEITTTQLETYIEVSDNVSADVDLIITLISNTYTANKTNIGRYEVVYSLADELGNTSYHTFVIFVVDQTPAIYTFPATFTVGAYENAPITEGDLTTVLTNAGLVVTELGFTVDVLEDNYTEYSTIRGTYTMKLLITYEDETSEIIDLNIDVISEPVADDLIPVIPGTIIDSEPSETIDVLGVDWYWWVGVAAVAFVLLSKKRR
ncbi:MAG: hypothetical protein JEZ05_08245 [Tenericutes bacterium]|nr:hypothetical protein [Mycoplasmatota bacterium]